jgi:YD repeat-containing protein
VSGETAENTVKYEYDAANRVTKIIDSATGTYTPEYDEFDRLKSLATPNGTIKYEYNEANERTSMTVPDRTSTATPTTHQSTPQTPTARAPAPAPGGGGKPSGTGGAGFGPHPTGCLNGTDHKGYGLGEVSTCRNYEGLERAEGEQHVLEEEQTEQEESSGERIGDDIQKVCDLSGPPILVGFRKLPVVAQATGAFCLGYTGGRLFSGQKLE